MSYYLRYGAEAKVITDEQANELIKSQKTLLHFMKIFAYKIIIQRNLKELIDYLSAFQAEGNTSDFDTVECERLLYNFLNTFYAFEQSSIKNYIAEIRGNFYRTYFEYGIISALRNYMEHCDLGISKVVVTVCKKNGLKAQAYINLKEIADSIRDKKQFDGLKSKVNKQINEGIDSDRELLPILQKFQNIFYELQVEIWKTLSERILESFSCYGEVVDVRDERKRDVYLFNGKIYICPISNAYHNFYQKFSQSFILSEGVMEKQDEDIKNIYRKLSFSYYKENGRFFTLI